MNVKEMNDKTLLELSEVVQSSHLNFLLGAGVSTPFFPLLGKIEKALNESPDQKSKEVHYKKYFQNVMLPNKAIVKGGLTTDTNFQTTKSYYNEFFQALSAVLLQRKSTLLSKQANLFTTNIDVFMETMLEELQLEYNDGFSGRFNPCFSIANFKKSIHQRSLHFDHISEIPVYNIIKLHGSLTWKHDLTGEKILFSHSLEHVDKNLASKTGDEFYQGYKRILVVNPEETKHIESVLNVHYYELLRMYSSELEKENAALFILGFSMDDRHIREITLRAAKSNPTLRIFVFCSKRWNKAIGTKMEVLKHPNIQIFNPDIGDFFTILYFTETILKRVSGKNGIEENEKAKNFTK